MAAPMGNGAARAAPISVGAPEMGCANPEVVAATCQNFEVLVLLLGWETPKQRSGMVFSRKRNCTAKSDCDPGEGWMSVMSASALEGLPAEMLYFWKWQNILLQDFLESHHHHLSVSKLQIDISKRT